MAIVIGAALFGLATFAACVVGAIALWRKGKLERFGFPPPKPKA